MANHKVDVSDNNGTTVRLMISLPPIGDATWHVVNHKFLRLQAGIVELGRGHHTAPAPWIACYGGRQVDDDNLVLHLDNFLAGSRVNPSGSGTLYKRDNLLLTPGALKWSVAA